MFWLLCSSPLRLCGKHPVCCKYQQRCFKNYLLEISRYIKRALEGNRTGDVTTYTIVAIQLHKELSKTPEKPLWLQPVLVNKVKNLRGFGL